MWDDKYDEDDVDWIETFVICDKCGARALWASTKTGIDRDSIGDWMIVDIIRDENEKDFFAELCPTCTKPILAYIEANDTKKFVEERKASGDYCTSNDEAREIFDDVFYELLNKNFSPEELKELLEKLR